MSSFSQISRRMHHQRRLLATAIQTGKQEDNIASRDTKPVNPARNPLHSHYPEVPSESNQPALPRNGIERTHKTEVSTYQLARRNRRLIVAKSSRSKLGDHGTDLPRLQRHQEERSASDHRKTVQNLQCNEIKDASPEGKGETTRELAAVAGERGKWAG